MLQEISFLILQWYAECEEIIVEYDKYLKGLTCL